MNGEHSRLHDAVDAEIAAVEASADAVDDDEPERGPLEIRLHDLHDAVVAVEAITHGAVTGRPGDRSLPATRP